MSATVYYSRTVKEDTKYLDYLKTKTGCDFCNIGTPTNTLSQVREENELFWIVINAFPYTVFDGNEVADHIMIVPKKHVESISELSEDERQVLIELINKYEPMGYSFMGRDPNNSQKSITHQHTHLIKLVSK